MTLLKLTPYQKMMAFEAKFYQGMKWIAAKGHYYTTTRNDLQLYQVVDVDDQFVYTIYCGFPDNVSKWPVNEFTTHGFGPCRMWVPDYILGLDPACGPIRVPTDYYPEPNKNA